MMDLNELKGALNWQGVFQGRDCLVVAFNEADAYLIQGLRANDQCFYLGYPEYQNHPISFHVTRGSAQFQYWVLGDRLHRANGPAKIATDTSSRTSTASWYQNGLKHNRSGPAEVILRNHKISTTHPNTGDDLGTDYVAETWGELEAYWFEDGVSALYPKPFAINCKQGYRVFRTTNGDAIIDDFRGQPAFFADKLIGTWNREGDMLSNDPFRLRMLKVAQYTRSYHNGVPDSHDCAAIDQMSWIIQGEIQETSKDKRETIRRDMFSEWNIWEGPLFPNNQEKVFALGEVNS